MADDVKNRVLPEGAKLQANGTVIYTLQHPITFEKGNVKTTVDTLTIRRKNMGDTMAVKELVNGIDILVLLIERLTGIEPLIIEKLDDNDVAAFQDIVDSFTWLGLKVGKETSV